MTDIWWRNDQRIKINRSDKKCADILDIIQNSVTLGLIEDGEKNWATPIR